MFDDSTWKQIRKRLFGEADAMRTHSECCADVSGSEMSDDEAKETMSRDEGQAMQGAGIREATPEDLHPMETLAEIHNPPLALRVDWQERLLEGKEPCYALVDGERLAGWAVYTGNRIEGDPHKLEIVWAIEPEHAEKWTGELLERVLRVLAKEKAAEARWKVKASHPLIQNQIDDNPIYQ